MNSPAENVVITPLHIWTAVEAVRANTAGLPEIVKDHERRIRLLERAVWQAAAASAAMGVLAGTFVPQFLGR